MQVHLLLPAGISSLAVAPAALFTVVLNTELASYFTLIVDGLVEFKREAYNISSLLSQLCLRLAAQGYIIHHYHNTPLSVTGIPLIQKCSSAH